MYKGSFVILSIQMTLKPDSFEGFEDSKDTSWAT